MSLKFYSTGDVMLGENVHHFHRGFIRKFNNNYTSIITQEVKDTLADADFVLINLESSLATEVNVRQRNIENGVYVAPIESIELLKELNTRIIANIANNHFSQHGNESALFTINKLEHEGIRVVGKNHMPLAISPNGVHLKIWGVSLINDMNACGAYFISTYENLIKEIYLEPKLENEFWIISIHWGEEYYTKENEKQRILAKQLSEIGFDLILGHHPHVMQPVETIGDACVVYSHGNFIFDQNFSGLTQRSLICKFNFPDNKPKFFFSQQNRLRVTDINSTNREELNAFCKRNYHYYKPVLMRFKMKFELVKHFYELNIPIIRKFAFGFLSKNSLVSKKIK